jgi:hypothetical protein
VGNSSYQSFQIQLELTGALEEKSNLPRSSSASNARRERFPCMQGSESIEHAISVRMAHIVEAATKVMTSSYDLKKATGEIVRIQ